LRHIGKNEISFISYISFIVGMGGVLTPPPIPHKLKMKKGNVCRGGAAVATTIERGRTMIETIKEKVSVVDVLERYAGVTVPNRNKEKISMKCPFHDDQHPSFAIDTKKNIAKCFAGCLGDKAVDVIGLTQKIHNVDFKEAVSMLARDFGIESGNQQETKKAPTSLNKAVNAPKNYERLYKTLAHDDYFLNRGLSKEIIEQYGLGAIDDQTDLSGFSEIEKSKLFFYRYIIPISERFFIARLDETRAEGARYMNFGEPELLNGRYIGDETKTFIFIAEGAFDALSAETLGFPAIALNSASNANKLIKAIQQNEEAARRQQYILLPDHDDTGDKLAKKLAAAFRDMNMTLHVAKYDEQYKDLNDFAAEHPDRAAEALGQAIDESMNGNSAFHVLIDFFTNMKRIEPLHMTIFPKLDEVLGGLRAGLYVIGAASSIGKTTFVQAIADDIAAQGEHVLYFSLEMSKKELIAKSLVRTMSELKKEQRLTGEITYARDLLTGNIKDHGLLMAAVGAYEKTAKNLFIYEGMFDMNVYTIRAEIEKHINLHGKKPLVIVDYLQILEPVSDKLNDKQATDKNVTELKRITRDFDVPLIAISSFNRESYNREASFLSFKESGAIEYGSDVVIALELCKVKELEKDSTGKVKEAEKLDEAKGSLVRDINLKVLKNRFGKAFEEIKYQYITTMNKFIEEGKPQAKETKRI